jgi:hypothetical protein
MPVTRRPPGGRHKSHRHKRYGARCVPAASLRSLNLTLPRVEQGRDELDMTRRRDRVIMGAMTATLDPGLLLQGYAAGIFPMADSRDADDIFWVEPRNRAIIPLDASMCRARSRGRSARAASRHPRPRLRTGHARLRRPRGDLDQPGDRARDARPPRRRPRPFDRMLGGERASWSAASTASSSAAPSSAKACSAG